MLKEKEKKRKMKFTDRVSDFPDRKKIIKVDENNVSTGEEPILVNIVKEEGTVYTEGTPIDAESLNKGNWRDDESLSFKQKENNGDTQAKTGETQIVTDVDGKTWLIPPSGFGAEKNLSDPPGTKVKVNNIEQNEISFSSDPQTQLCDKISSSDIVQSSGQNVNKIMSQKAVSNELNGKVNIAQGSGNANKMLGTDGSGNVVSMNLPESAARKWRALYQTARTATGAFTISNIFTTVPDATEIMVVGGNTSVQPGMISVILPLYCLGTNGSNMQLLNPSTAAVVSAASYNTVKLISDDGNSNSYWLTLRFNTNTQATIASIGGSGTTLFGIYVR